MSKTCIKLCYRFPTLYRGRGGFLNRLFKIPIIFCHWLQNIIQRKNKELSKVIDNLFQRTHIYGWNSIVLTSWCKLDSHHFLKSMSHNPKLFIQLYLILLDNLFQRTHIYGLEFNCFNKLMQVGFSPFSQKHVT